MTARKHVIAHRAAAIGIAFALTGTVILASEPAIGVEAKHPIPSIAKSVSADGRAWGEEAVASAGGTVRYRLAMTMSETVGSDAQAVYQAIDIPDNAVAIDASTLQARIAGADGNTKTPVAASVSFRGRETLIDFGDLKAACPDLSFGDVLYVEYDATITQEAQAHRRQNIARLRYDLGDGAKETVETRALVNIPKHAGQNGAIPKTGDELVLPLLLALPLLVIAASAIVSVAFASARSAGKAGKGPRGSKQAGRRD